MVSLLTVRVRPERVNDYLAALKSDIRPALKNLHARLERSGRNLALGQSHGRRCVATLRYEDQPHGRFSSIRPLPILASTEVRRCLEVDLPQLGQAFAGPVAADHKQLKKSYNLRLSIFPHITLV